MAVVHDLECGRVLPLDQRHEVLVRESVKGVDVH
jgi:hypothetical protein